MPGSAASALSASTSTLSRPWPRFKASSIASTTRTFSTLPTRKRSATTSSSLRSPASSLTMRSPWTRVKPLVDSHCVTSAAVVLAGSSTGKVTATELLVQLQFSIGAHGAHAQRVEVGV